jgi:glycosyltransferase involved in cell wall biosynthesis
MSTIKVLHVIARMNVGGTARYVEELIKNIPDSALATGHVQGAEVEDSAVDSLPVFRIHHLGRKISPIADFKAWRELSKVIREQKPEILHTHTFKAGLIGRLTRGPHKKVHTFHGHLFDDNSFSFIEKKIIVLTEKLLAHRTDIFVSVGQNVGKELRDAGIGSNRRWISIAPGVRPLPIINKVKARTILELSNSKLIVGWMARMAPVKNPGLLLKIASQFPTIQFVMAGGGELLDEITLNAPANVKVLGWTDSSTFWSAVDIGISTSDNEGMPIALIEAQLAGVPVIATDVGSNSEVVDDQVTGLVTKNSTDALVKAVRKFETHPSLIGTLGASGKVRSSKEFSVIKMISSHISLYQEIHA